MNNLKEAILERLINCGKKNKRLRTPVMMLIMLFLILFHGIRNFFMQFKMHPFRRRVLAGALCVCMIVSSVLAVDCAFPALAAENAEDVQENTYDGIREIVSFTELLDEVKEQTVAVGTPLESLALPDTLTAVCRMANEKDSEDNPDSDKGQDLEEEDKQPDEGNEEESGESGNEDEESEEESGDSDNEGEGTGDESEDVGDEGEGNEEESGDSSSEGEENEEAVEKQETFTVTLPEYYAMPDELPEIKELFYEETVTIGGITWESMPEYDSESEGVYLFTPVIFDGTYTLAEDVKLPKISVTVAETEIMLAEEELPDVSGSTTPVCGIISSDTTWEAGTLDGDLIIMPEATLTINGRVNISGTVTIKGGGTILRGSEDACIYSYTANVTVSNIIIDGASILSNCSMVDVVGSLIVCAGCTIRNCCTVKSGASGAGAIHVSGNLIIEDTTIENCSATGQGGAIAVSGNLTIEDTTIENCSANSGGAINAEGASMPERVSNAKIKNTTIKNCSANHGGAILLSGHNMVAVENTTIENCFAENFGGAVDIWGDIVTMDHVVIENCYTNGYGGAIVVGSCVHIGNGQSTRLSSNLTINSGRFINNKANSANITSVGQDGGGCIWASGTLNIYDGEFIGNTSASRGGCIYQNTLFETTLIDIRGGYFEGNTCKNEGFEGSGAVYISGQKGSVIVSADALFCESDSYGTDGIMLDNYEDRVWISNTLNYPVTIYAKAREGRVIAEGKDVYKLSLEKDIKKIKFVNISNSGLKYYMVLDEANNQIKLSRFNPGYGYSIHYISNGAQEQVVDNTIYKEGDTITVKPADGLSREGYHFTGWNTQPDGSGISYQPGDTIEGIEEDITLYAQWKVDGAEYKVEHYLQDVSGDGYTRAEADTEILGGNVGEEVKAIPKTYRGFTENTTHASRKESGVLASDGSLVLKLYYDRDVYNIAFDLNGGTGTTPEAQELRYGALLQEVSKPEKPGYTFQGWYMGGPGRAGKAWDFSKTVEENTENKFETLYAGWLETSIAEENEKPTGNNNSPTHNSATSASEQIIVLADESQPLKAVDSVKADGVQPLKTADSTRDNEPRTGDTSQVEVYATIAMVSGLLYVLLYFTTDKNGMTQEEKEQFLSCLISWAKRGGKLRRLFATVVIFLFLVYYHSIGKCVAYDVKEIRV